MGSKIQNTVLDVRDDPAFGQVALILRQGEKVKEYVVAYGYDSVKGDWGHGRYISDIRDAVSVYHGLPKLEYLVTGPDPEYVRNMYPGLSYEEATEIAAAACDNISGSAAFWDDVGDWVAEEVYNHEKDKAETAAHRAMEALGCRDARDLAIALDGAYGCPSRDDAGILTKAELGMRIASGMRAHGSIDRDLVWAYNSMGDRDLAIADSHGGCTWPVGATQVISALKPDMQLVEEAAAGGRLDALEAECGAEMLGGDGVLERATSEVGDAR